MTVFMKGWFTDKLKTRIHSVTKHCCVLLGDAQQFCSGFEGKIFVGITEQNICLEYYTINLLV